MKQQDNGKIDINVTVNIMQSNQKDLGAKLSDPGSKAAGSDKVDPAVDVER